jgi:CHAT domain-containing protein
LVVGVVACTFRQPPDAQDLTEELVSAVGSSRYIEGRVPGGFRFGPPQTRYRSNARTHSDPPAILSVLAKAEALPSRHTPRGLLLRGVARLLAGRVDQSLSLLSLSAAAEPSGDAWAALSAAYLEAASAKPDKAIELTARALDAAEQAIALDERSAEAWFNRAMAATYLPPCEPAQAAWDEYVGREPDAEWRAEAQRRKGELVAECRQAHDFEAVPGHVRNRIEHELLPGWARAWIEGRREDAERSLSEAERVATPVSDATGDPFAVHLVRGISDADSATRDRRAAAWVQYAQSRELFERSHDAEAAAVVGAARRSGNVEPRSPLALLIEVHFATMALQQGKLDIAAASAQRAIDVAASRGYPGLVARAKIVRAIVRFRQGRLSDAARDHGEAGAALERLHEPDLAAAAYGGLATSMRSLNDRRGTWAALAKTLHVVDRVQNPRRRYVVLYNASLVAQGSGVVRAALRYQSAAVDVAEQRGVAGTIVEAYTRRAELRERLRSGSGAKDLAIARARSEDVSDAGRVRYYSALIDAIEGQSLLDQQPAQAQERFGRALDFFATYDPTATPRLHLGRGRASRRIGDVTAARQDFLAGITAFETGRLKVSVADRVAYFDAARELFDEMVTLSAHDAHLSFEFAERGRALTVVEALGGPVETSTERIAAQLPRDSALVQYATLPDRIMIWVVTPDGTHVAVVPKPRASLEQLVLSLLAAVADEQGTTDVTTRAEALYRVLLRPVERHLASARHLVVVGDGPIHRVPFALLRTDGRHLIERVGIVNALSASAFLAAERNEPSVAPALDALVVGNPAYDRTLFEGLRPLPSATREAAAVAAMYPRGTLLTGPEATRARFIKAATGSSVIHFGGHAVSDVETPDRSALLLATDESKRSTLTAPEIARLELTRAPVVVLAACSTATGTAYQLEGTTSLSRAFLLAGASSVVGSLWGIEDDASEAFFIRFHGRLAAGDAPAEALRAAQLELLRSADGRLKAPRTWAAFQLIGALTRPSA